MRFAEVVAALDAGDLGAVRALVAARPELLHAREENGRDDYFARPYLLWYVAENPVRRGVLPGNIVAITRALLEAGAEGRDSALALVVSGRVPRECGLQLELIDALVEAGADPNCLDAALAHSETAAAERLLAHGARLTLVAAACLDRPFDAATATAEQRQVALAGAALHGRVAALRTLIAAGVDVNAFNPARLPRALDRAAQRRGLRVARGGRSAARRRRRPDDPRHDLRRHRRGLVRASPQNLTTGPLFASNHELS